MSEQTSDNSFQYGLNDKVMFGDAIKYLERLQQPFYTKFITVSHHYPYLHLSGDELGFPLADTNDKTINAYFSTANYLDSAVASFFDYLKKSGLYDNLIIVLYGDHYGISNSRNPDLAPLLGKDPETWSAYNNAMLQRVPYMLHIPGMGKGYVNETYGGLVDTAPTLLHALGIDSSPFIQLGQDLLSPDNKQIVAFRSAGNYITPDYTNYSGRLYQTQTGIEISNPDDKTLEELQTISEAAKQQLKMSDTVQTRDLLRFHQEAGLPKVRSKDLSYLKAFDQLLAIEKERGVASTSLFNQNGDQSTRPLYHAPSFLEANPSKP
ncbi:type I phosphodiesterase/nucleotide pyrophosphatase domain protein [Streptococcus ictaluri 707-05]|uniref:Type I phosphodiesterase/nucleotide pyrophosphatase domain protein n=1 Tax=Streptococcus ictaluri 707-05 TaxID=764299 RepID=G5JZH1_9STRE|nr:type I phosphodiesterase/nucleotide pyrophosphatase domain protein [Streptococcus ictaluri 707-05]